MGVQTGSSVAMRHVSRGCLGSSFTEIARATSSALLDLYHVEDDRRGVADAGRHLPIFQLNPGDIGLATRSKGLAGDNYILVIPAPELIVYLRRQRQRNAA